MDGLSKINVGLVSLGCPKALVDSERMAGVMRENGMELCAKPEDADIIVINTCGFLQASTQESLETISSMEKFKTQGRCRGIVVAGCLVERYPKRFLEEHPEVDAVLGTSHFSEIAEAIKQILRGQNYQAISREKKPITYDQPIYRLTPTHFSYVKISEGCDHPCRFCVIPRIKGPLGSRVMEDIENEVRVLARSGTKEVIIVGQDTTDYGRDIYQTRSLPQLLKKISKIDGIEWIRILYAYPAHVSNELIDVIAEERKICKYLDMPLQHADDEILKAMARPGNRETYTKLISSMREKIKGLALRTTFIVGYPGESEIHFNNLLEFMKEIHFERLGIFKFSKEPGTYSFNQTQQVDEEVKQERLDRAMVLQQEISKSFGKSLAGKTLKVLCDQRSENDDFMVARAYFDAPEIDGSVMVYDRQHYLLPGQMVNVSVVKSLEYDLVAEIQSNKLSGIL